jgi:hypothetical protein
MVHLTSYIYFYIVNLHSDFEDSQKPESSQDRQSEGARLWLEVAPHHLEDTSGNDEAVEPVERGLEVGPRKQIRQYLKK